MTTLDLSLDQISRDALALRPMRVLLWIVAAPFILIGVVLRIAWLVPAFLISSGRNGWRIADTMIKQLQTQAREQAARGG